MTQGAPSIIETIRAKSDTDAKRAVETARRIAEREEAAAERTARAREEKSARELEAEASAQLALAKAQAKTEVEQLRLRSRQEMVEQLMTEGLERLRSLPRDEEYLATLARLVREAVEALSVKEASVKVSPGDREFLLQSDRFARLARDAGAGTRLTLSEETVNAAGGAVVESADGKVSYYNTFDEIAYRRQSEIKSLISQELFG